MKHATKAITRAQEHKSNRISNIEYRMMNFEIPCSAFIILYLTCAFMTCVVVSARANALPKTASLVPPETVLLVDVDDFSELKKQFEKTNFYELYKDPAMAAFVEDVKTKYREEIHKLDENDIFRTLMDTDVLPQGRVAFALVLTEQTIDANEPPVLFITQWGENIDKIKQAIDKMAEKNIEMGGHQKSSEDYRGVSIETMLDEQSKTFSYCFVDDCFIGAMNTDILKFAIAHIKGVTSATLADDADYNATMKVVGPYHDVDVYVNIKQIIKTALAKDTTNETQTIITNLGFDNVTSLGYSVGVARRPGISHSCRVLLKIEGGKKGICKMLDFQSDVIRAARFIPASAHSVIFANLNIRNIYEQLYNILYNFNPTTAAMMQVPLLPTGPEGQPGLELKGDIIDHLGAQIIIAQSTRKPLPADSMPTESLIAIAVRNRDGLEESLSLWHSKMILPSNPDAQRELLGHTIYLLSMPALPFFRPGRTPMQALPESGPVQMPNLAFTITDTHLILGFEPAVEQAIRTLSSSEAESVGSAEWFTSAKLAIPSVVGLAALEDHTTSTEILWWMLKQTSKAKKSGTAPGLTEITMFGPMAFAQMFNFDLLPEFDAVRKYFGSSVFYGVSRPDGFFFEFNYLNPTGTD
jgi:hypothetical protein